MGFIGRQLDGCNALADKFIGTTTTKLKGGFGLPSSETFLAKFKDWK
jgi:hypothetical protein